MRLFYGSCHLVQEQKGVLEPPEPLPPGYATAVSSPVATFEQSENVAIAHLLALPRGVASATASICACARC